MWGTKPATKRKSFGWYRAEVLGALTSIIIIWVVTGVLVSMAIQKILKHEYNIQATIMLLSATLGVVINVIMGLALQLHPPTRFALHSHSSDESKKRTEVPSHFTEPFMPKDGINGSVHRQSTTDAASEAPVPLNSCIAAPAGPATAATAPGASAAVGSIQQEPNNHESAASKAVLLVQEQDTSLPAPGNLATTACVQDRAESGNTYRSATALQDPTAPTDPVTALQPRKHSRGARNFNVRAAFVHVIGDFIQSVGVLFAAIVVYFCPSCGIADPICTLVFSAIVLVTTIAILREALNVLMEGIPHGVDYEEVQRLLLSVPGVARVHDLHIWSLSLDRVALSVHVVLSPAVTDPMAVRRDAARAIRSAVDVHKLTIQVEEYEEGIRHHCRQCVEPQD